LIDRGYDSEGIHGDVTQSQRELILKKFKLRKVNILVATDVAARGIDVNDLTHVVNYNLPQDPEAYVHRIGRTGRAGKHGTAITIVSPKEKRDLLFIQKIAKSTIRKEEVPSIADVIETKKMKLKTEIADLVEKGGLEEYVAISMELLEDGKPAAEVMAALLAYSLKDNLKELSYREVGAVAGGNHAATPNGQTRLFIAKGHMDRMNAENVAQYIADECNIDVNAVQDIRVFDKFSFVTVPNNEGETILAILGKSRNGRKPLVTRAKEKDSAGGGGGGNRNGGGNWGKPKFGGERKSFGGNREGGERGNREGGERTERSNREGGERKSFGERKGSFGDKRKEGGEKKFDRKPFEKRETVSNAEVSDRPVRKRENKMTDYLETSKPAKTEKPSKKKEGSSDLNDFMKKFDDDLSW
jgi:superfamily II DNA/RNA helicase